jgi:hypothetical protein
MEIKLYKWDSKQVSTKLQILFRIYQTRWMLPGIFGILDLVLLKMQILPGWLRLKTLVNCHLEVISQLDA